MDQKRNEGIARRRRHQTTITSLPSITTAEKNDYRNYIVLHIGQRQGKAFISPNVTCLDSVHAQEHTTRIKRLPHPHKQYKKQLRAKESLENFDKHSENRKTSGIIADRQTKSASGNEKQLQVTAKSTRDKASSERKPLSSFRQSTKRDDDFTTFQTGSRHRDLSMYKDQQIPFKQGNTRFNRDEKVMPFTKFENSKIPSPSGMNTAISRGASAQRQANKYIPINQSHQKRRNKSGNSLQNKSANCKEQR